MCVWFFWLSEARCHPPAYPARPYLGVSLGAPWKWQRAVISPMLTPSWDCLSNSRFQESCVFLG